MRTAIGIVLRDISAIVMDKSAHERVLSKLLTSSLWCSTPDSRMPKGKEFHQGRLTETPP
eukprot:3643187-Pleurochrysis_carterae.AAC.1